MQTQAPKSDNHSICISTETRKKSSCLKSQNKSELRMEPWNNAKEKFIAIVGMKYFN